MQIPVYVADAFTSKLFGGNPAAICPLKEWLPENIMQQLAAENNLAETAFIVPENDHYHIRWFTPAVEVKLCGHATLAAAHIFYTELGYNAPSIAFNSKSGMLHVMHAGNGKYTLDFPADKPVQENSDVNVVIFDAMGIKESPVYKSSFDYMVVLSSQDEIEALSPDMRKLAAIVARGVIATAPGNDVDFVSRCFFPQSGIDEDPVTGSAHTSMVPYWSERLGKTHLSAIQLSKRVGHLDCELKTDRVLMTGNAVTYMKGQCNTAS